LVKTIKIVAALRLGPIPVDLRSMRGLLPDKIDQLVGAVIRASASQLGFDSLVELDQNTKHLAFTASLLSGVARISQLGGNWWGWVRWWESGGGYPNRRRQEGLEAIVAIFQ